MLFLSSASFADQTPMVNESNLATCENCTNDTSISQMSEALSLVTDSVSIPSLDQEPSDVRGPSEFSVGVAPSAADPITPNNQVLSTNTPTYAWTEATDAQFYCLNVNDTSGNPVLKLWYDAESFSGPTCSVTPSNALAPGDYSWSVRSRNCDGNAWSSSLDFTICTSSIRPGKPVLVSPRLTTGTSTPTYLWNNVAGSTAYHLKVVDASNNVIIDQWNDTAEVLSGSRCSVRPNIALAAGINHKWWVQARNCNKIGEWSNFLSFRFVNVLPGTPIPISPRGLISTSTPTFVWTSIRSATNYYLQVVNSSPEPGVVIDEMFPAEDVISGSRCQVVSPTLLPSGLYFWRIMASNDAGNSTWSSYRYFQTVCSSNAAITKGKQQIADNSARKGPVKPSRPTAKTTCKTCKLKSN